MRLQKWMADAGVASRRKCEEYIAAGLVSVNGEIAALGRTVEEGDDVRFRGARVEIAQARVVLAFNKPRGVISAMEDPQGRKTVADYFAALPARLYNVGRLDFQSEGLLLMTNDGELAYRMTHPKYEIPKTYRVTLDAMLTASQLATLQTGVPLSDGMSAPVAVKNPHKTETGHFALELTLHEGRNREIRRMMEYFGRQTLRLQRIRVGNIALGRLKAGAWRYLTEEEVRGLLELCK